VEDERYTREYLEPEKRSIANAIQVFFNDGSNTDKIAVEYPIGHRRRRKEGMPLLEEKFLSNLKTRLPSKRCDTVLKMCQDPEKLENTPVHEFMNLLLI
jgi:2-methylcitrate dehydratase